MKPWLIVLVLFLAGCATPRYQTVYRYEPPKEAAGLACLEQCKPKLAICMETCQEKHKACVATLEPEVDRIYQEQLRRYEIEFQYYRHALDLYHQYLALGWQYYDPRFAPWPYYSGYDLHFPPTPPIKPKREHVLKHLERSKCDRDCGCQTIYDGCFLSCGGIKIPETKCIANCPPEK